MEQPTYPRRVNGVLYLTAAMEAEHRRAAIRDALAVIVRDPTIAAWLAAHDPKALQQAREALGTPTFDAPAGAGEAVEAYRG